MAQKQFSTDLLIDIVRHGGIVKTGVDIYNNQNDLVIKEDHPINNINLLLSMKNKGIVSLPICPDAGGGLWSKSGKKVHPPGTSTWHKDYGIDRFATIEETIKNINEINKEAELKFKKAKGCIINVLNDIKETGGQFDYNEVQETISELLEFLNQNESAFSVMTKDILSYDDYLYNHSTNVCIIATPVIKHFMKNFGTETACAHSDKLQDISIGFFLHDIGKVLLPHNVLNKKGRLTHDEFEIIKTHSTDLGLKVFEKNKIKNRFIIDSSKLHHAAMYDEEKKCYPVLKSPEQIPPYVKVCKIVDIYDAMTSKRCYKNAFNPVNVVNNLYNSYSGKNRELQLVLYSFFTVVGIYPPGSIISLTNGQMAYVMHSKGPIVIPFTDSHNKPLHQIAEPVDISAQDHADKKLGINPKSPIIPPENVYNKLPPYLRDMIFR